MEKRLEMPALPESEAAIEQIVCEAVVVEVLAAAGTYLISSVVDPFDKLRAGFTTATTDGPTASPAR
jgi:hypothetical protein